MPPYTSMINRHQAALAILKAEQAGTPIAWEASKEPRWDADPASLTWFTPQESVMPYLTNGHAIRLKPWTLGNEINGHVLPPGREWHRQDWKADMLPPPYRPALLGETGRFEVVHPNGEISETNPGADDIPANQFLARMRTTRPIPAPPPMVPLAMEDIHWDTEFQHCLGNIYRATIITKVNVTFFKETFSFKDLQTQGWKHRRSGGPWMRCEKPQEEGS